MPYTPPSNLSPIASKTNSPAPSRSQSFVNGQLLSPEVAAAPKRPNLPRSAGSSSYLSKHRRSPSLNDAKEVLYNGEAAAENGSFDPHGSLRQSPPPSNNALIPTGMTISPPDSAHNSSDEEDKPRGRGRQSLEAANLKELQAAISAIEQRRESSPNRRQHDREAQVDTRDFADTGRPPLSKEARKIAHSRSSTDSNIVFDTSVVQISSPPGSKQDSDEDDESDGTPTSRPSMVRKKSGELVRPALRPTSRRRPSSMPGTPTYSKAVHFDSHLEHVRHFLQVDRPLAVSAGSSPVEQYESETEFPLGLDESGTRSREPPYEWEIKLSNFPYQELAARNSLPVHVERIFLSSDNKTLIGSIAVQNLAFHKLVISRFTFDYWKTTSEVVADFNHDIRRKQQNDGLDRFNFSIKLADQVNLENKTMFFCVRYSANGQDYWDSNNGYNYQVDFSKKLKPQNGKKGARPLNTLPRSKPSPTSSGQRPKSSPGSFDDFAAGIPNIGFGQSAGSLMGEPKLKLRTPPTKAGIVPDAPTRRSHKSSQAFGNRYDFNSSLTAAKNNAYAALGDLSGLVPSTDTKQSSHKVPAVVALPTTSALNSSKSETDMGRMQAASVSKAPAVGPVPSKPAALLSEKPSLASQSYQELVEKYCFVGARGKSEEVRSH
jgi:Carbohydrate/starch-binding module (family 21)